MKLMSSNSLELVDKKLKELNEALNVLEDIEDKVIWAQDFASYPDITQALEPIHGGITSARNDIEHEIDFLEDQVHEYNEKLAEFQFENAIEV